MGWRLHKLLRGCIGVIGLALIAALISGCEERYTPNYSNGLGPGYLLREGDRYTFQSACAVDSIVYVLAKNQVGADYWRSEPLRPSKRISLFQDSEGGGVTVQGHFRPDGRWNVTYQLAGKKVGSLISVEGELADGYVAWGYRQERWDDFKRRLDSNYFECPPG